MTFPFFGTDQRRRSSYPPRNGTAARGARPAEARARIYDLAQQLSDGAKTPDEYVQRLLNYFAGDEFTYSEVPPKASSTLDGFLFDTKQGYCQQYSGAMALLLRMGGIPARVVTGFSPARPTPRPASTSCATSTRTPGSRPTTRTGAG